MYLHRYAKNLEMLQQVPPKLPGDLTLDRTRAEELVAAGLEEGGRFLTEAQSKRLLEAYGIPVNRTEEALSEEEAVRAAERIGYPVVMKILSPDIVHKTDAGGVLTALRSADAVREAYGRIMASARAYDPEADLTGVTVQRMVGGGGPECLVGGKCDPNFGPVVMFGMGGIYAEVLKDRAIGLPPLNRLLARRLFRETKVSKLLEGYRNQPAADTQGLEELLIRFSELLMDFPEIQEVDLNPVMFPEGRPLAVDARVRLVPTELKAHEHLVISPYPEEFEFRETTAGGRSIFIRPVKPEDAPALEELFGKLSPTTIYYRFFSPLKSISPKMLARFTQIDYDREVALVALDADGEAEGDGILAVGRIIGDPDIHKGEFAIVVGDPWQGKGIGAAVLQRCIDIARERGFKHIEGTVMSENRLMLNLGRKLGFEIERGEDSTEYLLRLDL